MFYLNVVLTANELCDVPDLAALLARCTALSRAEPGCLRYEVYHSRTDERVFVLNEHWTSREAWETHRQAEAVTTIYLPKVLPRVQRVAHVCSLLEPA